jgi:hypothetical protein
VIASPMVATRLRQIQKPYAAADLPPPPPPPILLRAIMVNDPLPSPHRHETVLAPPHTGEAVAIGRSMLISPC